MENQLITSTIMTDIQEFTEKYIDSKTVTFYLINVYDNFSRQKWKIEKRYSEFEKLYKNLSNLLPSIPQIPGKSIFKIKSYDQLTKRRIQLDNFLKECNNRKDILSNDYYKQFLELDKHSPKLNFNNPEKIFSILGLPLGIRDFYYYKEENIIFVACCDMNFISRLDSYFSNANFPWEKKDNNNHVSVGAIFTFFLNKEKGKDYILEKKFAKSYPQQTGVINFDIDKNILQVGLDSGIIILYKTSKESDFCKYEMIIKCKPHINRVMGIDINTNNSLIYSCSTDGKFCVTDMNNIEDINNICENSYGFTNLYFDKKNNRIFLTNSIGNLYIYLCNVKIPSLVNLIQTHSQNEIRGIDIQLKKNYIFTATNKGNISVLDLGIPGKEKLIKEISYFGGEIQIRIIRYKEENNELITGDQNGKITIWSLKTGQSIFAWKAHENAITQIYYDNENRTLISGGKDKKLLFWKLPEKWINEEVINFENNEIKILNDTMSMLKFQKNFNKNESDNDSSDDSLCGWDIRP